MDKVRVLRILEYVGDRQWVENQMNKGGVPMIGQKAFGVDGLKGIIKSTVIDQFPEVVEKVEEKVVVNNCSNCDNSWHHYSGKIVETICTLDSSDKLECQSDNYRYYTPKEEDE